MSTTKHVEEGSVSLTVPGRPEFLRLVRLAAADSGARADLSIDDVEDLRIAVDELTYALIGDNPVDELLTLRYVASPGVVEIEGTCAALGEAVVSELSQAIIGAVVDEHELSDHDGIRQFRLVKRSRT
jgi:serine/threonine-protein kinase RsbW